MHVGRAIALGAIVRVVEVELALVAAKAVVLVPVDRQPIVDAVYNRLAIAKLQQRRRYSSGGELPAAITPDAVWSLMVHQVMKIGLCVALSQRGNVADLREKFGPPLMREHLTGRAAFHRSTLGHRVGEAVAEIRPVRGALASIPVPPVGIVGVVGKALCARFVHA